MRMTKSLVSLMALALAGIFSSVEAVPSFARQTKLDCNNCHSGSNFPTLNKFGMAFKAGGFINGDEESMIGDGERLSLPNSLHASLVSKIRINGDTGAAATLDFPDEMALLIGGRAHKNVGFLAEIGLKGIMVDAAAGSAVSVLSFKAPIVFDVAGGKLGLVPFTTDGLGAAYGMEILSTGAVRNIRASEFSSAMASGYLVGGGAATGASLYFANDLLFVNYTPYAGAHGAHIADLNVAPDHYARVAVTPSLGAWNLAIGGQMYMGSNSAFIIDAQAKGDVGIPLMVYLSYGSAAASTATVTNNLNIDTVARSAMSILVEAGVVPEVLNVYAGYRIGTDASNGSDNALTAGVKWSFITNWRLSVEGQMKSGAANGTGSNHLHVMLFGGF